MTDNVPPPPPPPPDGLLKFGKVRFGTTFRRYRGSPDTAPVVHEIKYPTGVKFGTHFKRYPKAD